MSKKLLIKYVEADIYQADEMVLDNVNLEVHAAEFIYLIGKVGSGKSSLLKSFYHEVPVRNGVAGVLNYDLTAIKNAEVPFLRRSIGIVFQDFQLLTDRTVYSNLEFVLRATGWKDKASIDEQIESVLIQVGMNDKAAKMPHQLSGGEQQRVVIARALLNSPEIILADEPTGNIDPETGKELVELLYNIRKSGTTVIMATHNLSWLEKFPGRVIRCENGKVKEATHAVSFERVVVEEPVVHEELVTEPLVEETIVDLPIVEDEVEIVQNADVIVAPEESEEK